MVSRHEIGTPMQKSSGTCGFNQEKALVGAFSVIVKTSCGTDGALHSTSKHINITWSMSGKLQRDGRFPMEED